jgi:hypothetical protein
VQELPYGFFFLGDNVFIIILSSNPVQWQEETEHFKRRMQFFLSQLRIQIEKDFGLPVTK